LLASALGLTGCFETGQTEIARGNLLASQRKLDLAAEAYRSAARSLPSEARPLELLGHLLFDQRKWPEARVAYAEALQRQPTGAVEAEIGLARLDTEQAQLTPAFQRLDRVLAQHPNNLYARLSRANLAMRRASEGDAQRAIEDTARALEIAPANPTVLYTRGCAFLAARQIASAQASFAELSRSSPSSPLPFYGMARVAAALNTRADVLLHLGETKVRARSTPGAWISSEVRADPAFQFLKDDPEFLQALSQP
jgi:tetratricopeptide (TPR) repeat protein